MLKRSLLLLDVMGHPSRKQVNPKKQNELTFSTNSQIRADMPG